MAKTSRTGTFIKSCLFLTLFDKNFTWKLLKPLLILGSMTKEVKYCQIK